MKPYGQGPGSPYKAIVDGLWPQLGDEDPRQHAWDVAYREVSSRAMAYRDPQTGVLRFVEPGEPDPSRSPETGALLSITCMPALHNGSGAPMLAEVWQTSVGLLFAARLAGRMLEPDEAPGDPFDPPAAARRRPTRTAPEATASSEWQHVPITIVRMLLHDDVPAGLWVRCVDHGPSEVDRVKLFREYERHMASQRAGTPERRYVRLDSVAALSSD